MEADNHGGSDSDSSYVILSDNNSVGSDSENYVIVDNDKHLITDSDGDHQSENVVDGDSEAHIDSGEDKFVGENLNEHCSTDSDEDHRWEKVVDGDGQAPIDSGEDKSVDWLECIDSGEDEFGKNLNGNCSTDSDESLGDYSGLLWENSSAIYVDNKQYHRYPCKRIAHICGENCYVSPGQKNADEDVDINDVAMEYVLPFLPAKTLCRFRSVVKKWNCWITNPFFMHKQTHFFRNISGFIYQLPGDKPSFLSLDRDAYGIPSPSLDFLPNPVYVRTACNGLLCCQSCNEEDTYYICNPVNKEWTVLPKSKSIHGPEAVLALAFEPSALNFEGEFQLVCAFTLPGEWSICFDIYSSKLNTWELSTREFYEIENMHLYGQGLFLKGSVFWESLSGIIFGYNLKKNEYSKLPLPPSSGPQGVMAEMYGELCYILPVMLDHGYTLEIYADTDMELKRTIPLALANDDYDDLRALACVNDDVVILLHGRKLISYDVKAGKADIIDWRAGTDAGYAAYIPYVNNFVHVHTA